MEKRAKHSLSTPPATGFAFAAFIFVLLGGALLGASAIARLERAPDGSLRSGEWTAQLQAAFEEALPIYEPALHAWTALRYAAFGEGGPGLIVGKDDWLFTAEELEVSSAERARVSQTASYIVAVGTELFERGARLAVVLLPSKARIYEDKLPGQGLPALVDRRYDTALKLIRDQVTETSAGQPDLEVVDPRPPLRTARRVGTEVFLRTDTHWSPEGAQIVAEAVARELEPVLARGEIPRTVFRNRPAGSVSHRGDLLRFLPLGPFETALGPPADVVTRYETFPAEESEVGGLLDDPAIPGALVGTSYSADELWNFRGALSVALQIDFLTVAAEGEGPFAPMMSYLEGETIVDQPPELVIWEIPERYLAHDLPAGWRSRIGD